MKRVEIIAEPPGYVLIEVGPSSVVAGTKCTAEEGKTRQSEAQAADINWIVKKYESTGVLPVPERAGFFADISAFPTFQEALGHVEAARNYFMSLPPVVRAEFENSAVKFLDCWNAGEKRDIFVSIGLLERLPEPEAPAVVAAREAAAREARVNEYAEGHRRGARSRSRDD